MLCCSSKCCLGITGAEGDVEESASSALHQTSEVCGDKASGPEPMVGAELGGPGEATVASPAQDQPSWYEVAL